ncbi:MAG TPA: GAF domain-containing protein [Jatrophihabitans sp.]|jgi:PAS domain S-box-containing protein|uniref:GAF domain-containing protein n=1 Tax=Jatrophihabitans sp. TaxID=1932789 RepID=UPI002F01D177
MVVAEPELSRFLAELTTRRRVLTLAGASGSGLDAEVLAELAELADQLVVADAELRAQHEELEAGREALLRSQAEYERLLAAAGAAYLLTDQHGVVGQLNPAAEMLLGPSPVPWRRPLAAKFAVEDRGRIRTVLSQLKRSSSEPATCRARLVRSDGSLLEVEVTACSVTERADGATLSWQLRPVSQDRPPGLGSAPAAAAPDTDAWSQGKGSTAQPPPDLLTELSNLAAVLAGRRSAQEVLDQAVRAAGHAVSGAEQASICLVDEDGIGQSPSSTGELATECDRAQCQLGEGPCLQALPEGQVLRIDDLSAETRWPAWAVRARALGAGSMLASQLTTARGVLGTLNLYSSRPHAFDSTADALVQVLAAQVGIALARVDNEANLQAAIQNRQLIGQAVGILMERHRLGPTAAFDLLVEASQFSQLKLREIALRVNETGLDPADAARRH